MAVASAISTAAFVVNILFMIALVQSGGGLFAGCKTFGFFDISEDQCQSILSTFLGSKPSAAAKDLVSLALVFPRVEACLFLGMGLGSIYAFIMGLERGTKDVAVIHFMHMIWAIAVCACHSQNAGLFGMTPERNVTGADKLVPFVVLTGVQAVLYTAAFILSSNSGAAKSKKRN